MEVIVNNAPSEDQMAEDPAAVTPPLPPSLSLTSLHKLEVVYDTSLHLDDGIHLITVISPITSCGRPSDRRSLHSRPSATMSRQGE